MTDKKTDTETTTRKPTRRKRVDENPAVQGWMAEFISNTKERVGVTMTMDQAGDAFVAWAFKGTKPDDS